jgi:hypothetical protein
MSALFPSVWRTRSLAALGMTKGKIDTEQVLSLYQKSFFSFFGKFLNYTDSSLCHLERSERSGTQSG